MLLIPPGGAFHVHHRTKRPARTSSPTSLPSVSSMAPKASSPTAASTSTSSRKNPPSKKPPSSSGTPNSPPLPNSPAFTTELADAREIHKDVIEFLYMVPDAASPMEVCCTRLFLCSPSTTRTKNSSPMKPISAKSFRLTAQIAMIVTPSSPTASARARRS